MSSLFFVSGAALYIYSAYYAYDYFVSTGATPTQDTSQQQPVIFQANAKSQDSQVTDYMACTFAAALCFAMMGSWNLCNGSTSSSCWTRLISHGTWTVAAVWAMASSALVIKDPYLSEVFHSVSVHLYLFAALILWCTAKGRVPNDKVHLLCCTNLRWLRLADTILVLGTMGDVALSYLMLWKEQVVDDTNGPITQEHLLYAGMATAGCWGVCALVHFAVSFGEACCCRSGAKHDEEEKNHDDEEEDLNSAAYVYEDKDEEDEIDVDESQRRKHYAPNKYLGPEIKQEQTEDTANDDASVSSFASWWTAGPATKDGITRSSLDKIFGR